MSWFGRGVPAAALLLFITWVLLLEAVVVHSHQIKRRQIRPPPGISSGCINAFFGLESSDLACLLRLGENVGFENGTITIELTTEQLDFACGSSSCQQAFVTLIEACENEVRGAIDLSDAVDLVDLLALLCVRDQNGGYCYHELERPILQDDHDPLLLCNLRSPHQLCSADCKTAIGRHNSTCCLVSYLYLVAGNSVELQNIATSLIWQSCNLTAPSLCTGVARTNSAICGNSKGDDGSDAGVIVGGVIGALVIILLIAILGIQLTYMALKYRARNSYGVNGQKDDMKLKFADHEHTEAMTT